MVAVEAGMVAAADTVAADTSQALADMAAGLAGTAADPCAGRILAGRASAARILRLIQSEAAVSPARRISGSAWDERALQVVPSEAVVRSVPDSARAIGSPAPRPTRSGVPRHARAIPVAGCSATAPSPTSRCNRNSGRRASTGRSLVQPGPGGVAAWPSAG